MNLPCKRFFGMALETKSSLPPLHAEPDNTSLVHSHVRKILPLMSDEVKMGK